MSELVSTSLAPLFVSERGAGPPVVLFHSLFVDQRSWDLVADSLPNNRLLLIDAPNHGRSSAVGHDFTIADTAVAAAEVLDHLSVREPVHWVGNALGGHVGITLAGSQPERVRSLVTIGTPVEPFTKWELWSQMIPLVVGYRLLGARPFAGVLTNALLGPEAVAANPHHAKLTMDAFRNADRTAMYEAMRCLMLRRRSVAHFLPSITIPTLMLVAEGGQEGWTPDDAQRAADTMPNGTSRTVPGFGHIAPLVQDADQVGPILEQFWAAS